MTLTLAAALRCFHQGDTPSRRRLPGVKTRCALES